jgi:hypothetical protein
MKPVQHSVANHVKTNQQTGLFVIKKPIKTVRNITEGSNPSRSAI